MRGFTISHFVVVRSYCQYLSQFHKRCMILNLYGPFPHGSDIFCRKFLSNVCSLAVVVVEKL